MTATAERFQPTYYSEIVRETDGTYNDCVVCAALGLGEMWTLGELTIKPNGDRYDRVNLREVARASLGPAKADGGLTLADASDILRTLDPELPELPRYPNQPRGGNLRLTFGELWAALGNGSAAILLGNPVGIKDHTSPLRTRQSNPDYGHAILVYSAGPTAATVHDPLTRRGPEWRGERIPRIDLEQYASAYGTPLAVGCAVVRIGAETQAARSGGNMGRNLTKCRDALDAQKAQTALATDERDQARRELAAANRALDAEEARATAAEAIIERIKAALQ